MHRTQALSLSLLLLSLAPACKPSTTEVATAKPDDEAPNAAAARATVDARAIVAAADRDPADVEADLRRKPVELLEFLRLEPGMKVADIGAGGGYTTELLARAVGLDGRVYGQNTTFVLDRFARDAWTARLAKPVNQNVVAIERDYDDPFADDIEPLDRVINVLFYHDFEWMKVDRAAHNADVFAALRPGGTYVIVDSSAAEGRGASESETLHRIEESLVVRELEAAGFELTRSGEFMRNPADTRDWNALPWRAPERADNGEFSDKFVLEFTKPVEG